MSFDLQAGATRASFDLRGPQSDPVDLPRGVDLLACDPEVCEQSVVEIDQVPQLSTPADYAADSLDSSQPPPDQSS